MKNSENCPDSFPTKKKKDPDKPLPQIAKIYNIIKSTIENTVCTHYLNSYFRPLFAWRCAMCSDLHHALQTGTVLPNYSCVLF